MSKQGKPAVEPQLPREADQQLGSRPGGAVDRFVELCLAEMEKRWQQKAARRSKGKARK